MFFFGISLAFWWMFFFVSPLFFCLMCEGVWGKKDGKFGGGCGFHGFFLVVLML